MFNETIKQEYLSTVSDSVKYVLTSLFNRSELFEQLNQKDACDFIETEISDMMVGINSSSVNTIAAYVSLLRSYTQWCCDNNISRDHINHYDNISYEQMQKWVNQVAMLEKYISYEELLKVMDDIVNPCDKYLVLGLFLGIYGEEYIELTSVKADDVDRYNKTINLCTGRTVYVSQMLCDLALQAADSYDYMLTTGKRFESLKLDEGNLTVFKGRTNARFSTQDKIKLRVTSRLLKLREDTGCIALSIDRLRNSGILYHMKKAIQDYGINKEDIYDSEQMKTIQKQYNIEHQKNFTLRAKYKAYL